MIKNKGKDNIEVSVRARPLNNFEEQDGEETAWDVKEQQFPEANNVSKMISLKNKFRFGLYVNKKEKSPSKRIARSSSAMVRNNLGGKYQSITNLKTSRSVSYGGKQEQAWKYKSGAMRQSYSRPISTNKSAGFKNMRQPMFTPTPMRDQNTPEYVKHDVSDFQIYPSTQTRLVQSKILLSRNKSLTAIQSLKKSASVSRIPGLYANLTNFKSERPGNSFQTTKKAGGIARARARSAMGDLSPAREKRGIHIKNKFKFDSVFGERDTNLNVYKKQVKKVALAALDGINGTVFVYGQTGTGKTYTMMGHQRTKNEDTNHGANVHTPMTDKNGQMVSARTKKFYNIQENSGLLIYAMQDLFDKIQQIEQASRQMDQEVKFQIKLSYIEIYNEVVYDLLVIKKQDIENGLNIVEGKNREFLIQGANQVEVNSLNQVLELIKIGETNKHYAETFLNHCSSRSHAMFRLNVVHFKKQGNNYLQTKSYLNFVDLAGSEKISNYFGGQKATKAKDVYQNSRLKEGLSINKSLFNLTQVIHMLSQKPNMHIPFRNSTLTKLLRSSLGGNSRTSIIICITPANSQIEQTISSLKFGENAMKIQNSAKVQVNEIKMNALKHRMNVNLTSNGGFGEKILKEVVEEYETKIRQLERRLFENNEVQSLKQEVSELNLERERLIHALEINGDRTFFTKQLQNKQKSGHQVMSLQYAGDVAIQSRQLAVLSVEQIMDDKDNFQTEMGIQQKSLKNLVDHISKDLKHYKEENAELKNECDNLESAYKDILSQFSKMSELQTEIIHIQKKEQTMELSNIDKMTDREIQRIDSDCKKQINRIRDEKEKRGRIRKSYENLSQNSSGHLKNFMRPYNPTSIYSTKKKTNSQHSMSQGSLESPGYMLNSQRGERYPTKENSYRDYSELPKNSYRNLREQQELNPEHFNSKQGISEEQILGNKNLNSTFGMRNKQSIDARLKMGNQQRNSSLKIIDKQFGGVQIDKSLYAQETSYRPGGYSRSQSTERKVEQSGSQKRQRRDDLKLLLPLQMASKPMSHEVPEISLKNHANTQVLAQQSPLPADHDSDLNLPFAPINSFNQYLLQRHQFDVIKEEVHNENQVSSFDNMSHSQGFDMSTPAIPGLHGAQSSSAISQIQAAISSNSSIGNVNLIITSNQQFKDKTLEQDMNHLLNTPQQQELQVQPEHQASYHHQQCSINDGGEVANCNTFDKTLSKLSAISHNNRNKSAYDQPQKADSIVEMMNEELLMEFQLEQMLAQQVDINENINLKFIDHKRKSSKATKSNRINPQFITIDGQMQKQTIGSPEFSQNDVAPKREIKTKPQHPRSRVDHKDYVSFQKQDDQGFQMNFVVQNDNQYGQSQVQQRAHKKQISDGQGAIIMHLPNSRLSSSYKNQQYATGTNSISCSVLQSSTSANNPGIHSSEQFLSNPQRSKHQMILSEKENQELLWMQNKGEEARRSFNTSNHTSKKSKSSKVKNMSIDLSSTYRKSPQKESYEIEHQNIGINMFEQNQIDLENQNNYDRSGNKDQSYMEIIRSSSYAEEQDAGRYQEENFFNQRQANVGRFVADGYSDTLTPYGPINTNESDCNISRDTIVNSQQNMNHGEIIQGDRLLNINIKTKTPTNDNEKEATRHFFNNDREFQTGVFRSPNPYVDHQMQQDFKEATKSVENFNDDEEILVQTRNLNKSSNQIQPQIMCQGSRSGHEESSIPCSSSFNSKNYNKTSQGQSNTNSFKPAMTKEIKQIEKTNKKLMKHNQQYQELYDDMIAQSVEITEFKQNSSKRSSGQQSVKSLKQQVTQQNAKTLHKALNGKQKINKSRDNSNSMMSHSTSQGMTSCDQNTRNRASKANNTLYRSKNGEVMSHRLSHEFDIKSKMSRKSTGGLSQKSFKTSKVSQKSRKSLATLNTEAHQKTPQGDHMHNQIDENSPLAVKMMNERLSKFSSQIEPNWQQKSQASLDKMQQLQKEYEKIQQRRLKIMASLEAESSPGGIVLKENKPKVKSFEPIHRKHSPSIHFNSNAAQHMRNLSQQQEVNSSLKKRELEGGEWHD